MQFCTTCGRRRAEGSRFCTGCGQPFPDTGAVAGGAAGPGQPGRGAAAQPDPDRPPSRRPLRLAIIALIVVAVVGGGTASALVLTRHHDTSQAGGKPTPSTPSTASVVPSTAPAAPSTIPATPVTIQATPATVAPSPTASLPAGNGQVDVAASAAEDPQTPQVLDFLDSYFTAINSHSYQGYRALVNPAEADALTYASFQAGYGSTRDSAETLLGISTAANGETVAKMAFTSHQNAANSVDGSQTCTNWRVLLYLEPNGNGYLLGKSPPGYHSSHEAC